MRQVVIVEAVRTAIGRMGESLKEVEVDCLSETVMREVLQRSKVEGKEIDEVVWGHAKQSSDYPNLARVGALKAGIPIEVPGYTVHRQCASGLQAIINGVHEIMSGYSNSVLVGGAESMSTAPYYLRGARYGFGAGNAEILDSNTESQPRAQPISTYGNLTMGLTAENLAVQYNISRQEQDEFAMSSQEKATSAIEKRLFEAEIVPVEVKKKKEVTLFKKDEHPRLTSLAKLGQLKAVFKEGGTVTAGNSSGRNDGASALILMSEEEAVKRGFKPRARIVSYASAGVSPEIMGIGPVPATLKALQRVRLKLEDMDVLELNEAFAAQALAVMKELKLNPKYVNVNGGAIALGHPIGATGAILMTKLVHELERCGGRYGLVSLCIGGGQGLTVVIENLKR